MERSIFRLIKEGKELIAVQRSHLPPLRPRRKDEGGGVGANQTPVEGLVEGPMERSVCLQHAVIAESAVVQSVTPPGSLAG